MTVPNRQHDTRQRLVALAYRMRFHALRRPLAAVGALLAVGVLLGAGGRSAIGLAQVEAMQAADAGRQTELERVRREAQFEVNALAARLSELQAQANRLNALGARLTQAGQRLSLAVAKAMLPVGGSYRMAHRDQIDKRGKGIQG